MLSLALAEGLGVVREDAEVCADAPGGELLTSEEAEPVAFFCAALVLLLTADWTPCESKESKAKQTVRCRKQGRPDACTSTLRLSALSAPIAVALVPLPGSHCGQC